MRTLIATLLLTLSFSSMATELSETELKNAHTYALVKAYKEYLWNFGEKTDGGGVKLAKPLNALNGAFLTCVSTWAVVNEGLTSVTPTQETKDKGYDMMVHFATFASAVLQYGVIKSTDELAREPVEEAVREIKNHFQEHPESVAGTIAHCNNMHNEIVVRFEKVADQKLPAIIEGWNEEVVVPQYKTESE